MSTTPPVAGASPARQETSGRWADLPHELLVRIFAAQPEPLHNLGAEYTCRAWACAVREAPVHHMTLLAGSDAHAAQHAALLARRPNLRAVSMLRWAEWKSSGKEPSIAGARLRLPRAPRWEHTADAAVESLTPALRSLAVGVFALTQGTLSRLGRLASLSSLTLQTAGHNACLLADLGALRLHASLLQLRLLHHGPAGQPAAPATIQQLPHRLTSLTMHNWGCPSKELQMNAMLASLTSLQSLSLIGCGVALSMLDDGLGQLRRLLDLELCNGTFIISNPTRTTGPWMRTHEDWRLRSLRLTPQFAPLLCSSSGRGLPGIVRMHTVTLDIPASVQILHLYSFSGLTGPTINYRPALTGSSLRELHVDLDKWDAALVLSRSFIELEAELHVKCKHNHSDGLLTSRFAEWNADLCRQVVSLDIEHVTLHGNLEVLSHILESFPRTRSVVFRSRRCFIIKPDSPALDYAPYVLEDHPLLRTLTVELRTVCAYDLSGCGSLRALNLTLWQDGMDAVAPLLPRGLTALTLLINAWVPTITAEAPLKPRQLQQLCALRRLDLRYILRCDDTVSAFLPALPQGLTHLTERSPLARLTELRELIVHTPRPLRKAERLKRLPLLVFAHRTHHSAEGGCGLRCSPEADLTMGGATAPLFFPDRFDGHGYDQ